MKAERRVKSRKVVDPIHVLDLTQLDNYAVIGRKGILVDASSSGFLLHVHRQHLLLEELKNHLTLDPLHGKKVALFIPQMNLDIDGTIQRTRLVGDGYFEIAIDFSDEIPNYWRECLVDLLPWPGEFD